MRRILVTGANGFVGPHLARALAGDRAQVHGIGLGEAPAGAALASWRVLDVLDRPALEAAVADCRPEAVVHLAGQSSAARSFTDSAGTFQVNVAGTWNLLEAVRRSAPRARVLVVGSGEAYGPQAEGSRTAEDTPFSPVSPYALSKAAADAIAEAGARGYGLDVVRVRSFSHTGPGQTPDFVVPAFARQIVAIEDGRVEPVLRAGNLEVTRDLADVRDVVRAYVALLERGRSGAAYNVCRGDGVKLTDVVQRLIAQARTRVRVELDPARLRPADISWLVGDPSRIAGEIGWRAEIPLDRTLADVLEEWRGSRG
jgi:GDP-4-dehydro-6-deoxy-D-mannose reductase